MFRHVQAALDMRQVILAGPFYYLIIQEVYTTTVPCIIILLRPGAHLRIFNVRRPCDAARAVRNTNNNMKRCARCCGDVHPRACSLYFILVCRFLPRHKFTGHALSTATPANILCHQSCHYHRRFFTHGKIVK
jgi:hypothetical protein